MWIDRFSNKFKNIDYTNRDFTSIKDALLEYVNLYFPGNLSAFAIGTIGDLFLNLMAYTADNLHFYIDKQFSEVFLSRAIELKNIFGMAKDRGYYPKGIRSYTANLDLEVTFPTGLTDEELANYKFIIPKFTYVTYKNSTYEILDDILVDPTDSNSRYIRFDENNDRYIVYFKSNIYAISGITKTFKTSIDEIDDFPVVVVPETNITTIISVVDGEGNVYEEVKNLAQQFKYFSDEDDQSSLKQLKVKRIPYRYVKDLLSNGKTRLIFGNGMQGNDMDLEAYVPTASEFIDDNKVNGSFNNFNPQNVSINNFTKTNTLGVKPRSGLTITYRTSNLFEDQVPAGVLKKPSNLDIKWFNPTYIPSIQKTEIRKAIVFNNLEPSSGGGTYESIDDIRVLAALNYASQDRVITIEDYYTRIMSLPEQYGKFDKVAIKKGKITTDNTYSELKNQLQSFIQYKRTNLLNLDDIQNIKDTYVQKKNIDKYINDISQTEENYIQEISALIDKIDRESDNIIAYVLSLDTNNRLMKSPNTLKTNVYNYLRRFMQVSTSIAFQDANIINLKLEFKIQVDKGSYEPKGVLMSCIEAIQNELAIENMQIGKNIIKTELYKILHDIQGVISVPQLDFEVLNGNIQTRTYSNDVIINDISKLYTYNGAVLQCPEDAIFEIKYPEYDLIGSVTI